MSNIHNSEPQAYGLIQLKTTFGDLELELFTKQCPKISRNFVQLCLDGYYNGTIFDRVEKDFIAIGGKRTNLEIDSIETDKYADEFHSRLKFSRRGLLATANTEKNSNGPEFFFTLGPAPELQNKHSIFGRLRGDSVYHLVDLNECPVDEDLVPISEKMILEAIVHENPFPELKPRADVVNSLKKLQTKSPSEHDKETEYLEPKLEIKSSSKKLSFYQDDSDDDEEEEDNDRDVARDTQSDVKVQKAQDESASKLGSEESPNGQEDKSKDASDEANQPRETSKEARERRLREIREQIESVKKQIEGTSSNGNNSLEQPAVSVEDPDVPNQELRLASKKGHHRERETLELMENFKKKLKQTARKERGKESKTVEMTTRQELGKSNNSEDEEDLGKALEAVDDDAWMRHRFEADDNAQRNAKDANQRGDDWYSIDDPRNPIMQRVEAEKAREYKKYRSRDSRRDEEDEERRHSRSSRHPRDRERRSSRSSSRERHRHHGHRESRSRHHHRHDR